MTQFILWIIFVSLWLVAVVHDASHNAIGWLLFDLLTPLGWIRGLYLLFIA